MAHEVDIESLDRAIGETIAGMNNKLLPLPPDEALQKIDTKLLSAIGGASGALFASFFMGMARYDKKHHPKISDLNNNLETAAAFAYGVQSMMMRGKVDVGKKTL